jgi:hypothetical protein
MDAITSVDHLGKRHQTADVFAVDNVSFPIREGAMFSLFGRSMASGPLFSEAQPSRTPWLPGAVLLADAVPFFLAVRRLQFE